MRMLVKAPLAAALLTVVALSGCSRKQDDGPAVATPSLSLSRERVPIGSAVTLMYKFQVAPNATFDKNYYVFVHVLDPEGEQLWTEDHLPPTPTSAWKPGQTIEYKRTIFVPSYPYLGEAAVRLGLYDPGTGKRLVLAGQDVARHEYLVTKFQIVPSSENVYLIMKDGWYPGEVDTKNPASEWQWTKKTATISFRNPKKDSLLYLEYDARPDLFNPPQHVTVRVGHQPVGDFTADAKLPTLKLFPLTVTQLGGTDMVDVFIDVDKTFSPGAGDPRELGIRVFHAYLEPK